MLRVVLDGGSQLVYEGTYCLAWGVILTEGEIGVLSVSSLFLKAHTHTAHMGCSSVSPGVAMRHLEGPPAKNPVGLKLSIYASYMCTKYTFS